MEGPAERWNERSVDDAPERAHQGALHALGEQTERLDSLLDQLAERLRPVSSPSPVAATLDQTEPATELRHLIVRVERANARLSAILHDLDL